MNAAQLLAVTVPKGTSIRSQVAQQTSANAGGFTSMLREVLSQSNQATSSETNALATIDQAESASNKNDGEDLLEMFEELFGMLQLDEGFFDKELLKDPDVLALLNQLPQPLQQLLSKFINSEMSFEQALSLTEKGSKEQLSLLLLSMLQLEKNGQIPEQMRQFDFSKLLAQQVTELFKVDVPVQSQNGNLAVLVSKLVETLEKRADGQTGKSDSGQVITQMKTELTQVIQRVLYGEANNQGNSNNPSNPSEQKAATGVNASDLQETTNSFNEEVFDQLVNSSLKDGGSVNRIQQYTLNVQGSSGSALSEEQILNQLKMIMKQSKFTSAPNGTNQLMIRLNPAHLGTLTIKLTETNGEMMAKIIASTATAKEIIESNLNSLRHVFTTQNITVEKFEIQYQGDNPFDGTRKEQQDGQGGSNARQQARDEQDHSDSDSQANSFKDELLNMIV